MNEKDFLAKAKELEKTRGDILNFEPDKTYFGKFLEIKDIKGKGKKTYKIISLELEGKIQKFWAFGLLNWLINDTKTKKNDLIKISNVKRPIKKGEFYKCEFVSESEIR